MDSGWCVNEFYDAYQSVTAMAMRQSKTLEGYIEPQNTYETFAKDLVPGKTVTDNIQKPIQNNKRCTTLISKIFVDSKWCVY